MQADSPLGRPYDVVVVKKNETNLHLPLKILTLIMRLDHLSSLIAIAEHGSFSAAAAVINLSHSAVSIQMRQLENQVGAQLFDRSTRPPQLTPLGRDYVARARVIITKVDELQRLPTHDRLEGTVSFGFVPTTLQTILPVILSQLKTRHANLQVTARSGFSEELAKDVATGDLDFAFLSASNTPRSDITLDFIANEPLFLIAAPDTPKHLQVDDLLRDQPYIAFSPSTWLGDQIFAGLKARGISFTLSIELDSIDAVENLVAQGFGVSIVPQRLFADDMGNTLRCLAFGGEAESRKLVLASHLHCRRPTLRRTMIDFLRPQKMAKTPPL